MSNPVSTRARPARPPSRVEPKQRGKGPRKIFRRFIPRNPLIRLDSDERFQGNPRKSNSRQSGFSRRKGDAPRKSKPIGWRLITQTKTVLFSQRLQRLPPRCREASAHSARVARTSASRVSVRTRALAWRIAGRRSAIDPVVQRSACLASARRADIGNFTNSA